MRTPVAISTDAFAHEVIGDSSAVRVLKPSKKEWVEGLSELIASEPKIENLSDIPTWESFNQEVFDSINNIK